MGFGGGFRGRSSGGFRPKSFGPREMHDIKCSECGKDAQVPFKPRGDSPVYCRDCFMKQKGITPRAHPESGGSKKSPKEDLEEESLEASAGEASEDDFEEDSEEN